MQNTITLFKYAHLLTKRLLPKTRFYKSLFSYSPPTHQSKDLFSDAVSEQDSVNIVSGWQIPLFMFSPIEAQQLIAIYIIKRLSCTYRWLT